VRVLVTGAEGFVGGWLARRLLAEGRGGPVVGTRRPGAGPSPVLLKAEEDRIEWRDLELGSGPSVEAAVRGQWDAVFHLGALASGSEARADPGLAWEVNAAGTARLAEALANQLGEAQSNPLLILVSSGEVYGLGEGKPHRETDPTQPCSPYAASKLGAEIAALEVGRRTGLRTIVARSFPHTGPNQDVRFVAPALAQRLKAARQVGAPVIKTGNLDVIRDYLDVRDVVSAYLALFERGVPGETYNVASGEGISIASLLEKLERMVGWAVTPEPDARLIRCSEIRHLVGDAGKLRAATGWAPRIPIDRTLQDLVNAQAS